MHFIGVLFGRDFSVLDQYWEGLEVEPYIGYTKEEIISQYIDRRLENIKWRKEAIAKNPSTTSDLQQWLKSNPKLNRSTAWNLIKKDFEGFFDENGNILTTYNPKSEWDWYVVGGRWAGYFPTKKTDSDGNTIYQDEVTIEEVDWDKYFEERKSPYCFITEYSEEWKSKGDIGWFTSENEKSELAWQKEFKEELKKYSEDTVIVAIDFHI